MHVSGSRPVFGLAQLLPWFCETSLREKIKGRVYWIRSLDCSFAAAHLRRPVNASPVGRLGISSPNAEDVWPAEKKWLSWLQRQCGKTLLSACSRVGRY